MEYLQYKENDSRSKIRYEVLNLIINGIPSIQTTAERVGRGETLF